ncbi:MAG: hypothetical protein DME99_12380 [Verrucomicrobia bacterium]|nr:MAG: hypothetical protein DME99_12380 [Verrucomicrobiota bacterium]
MFDPRKIDTKLLIEAVPYLSMIEMQAIKHPNPQLPGDNGTVLSGSGLQDASLPASKCTVITTAWLRFRIDPLAGLLKARLNCRSAIFGNFVLPFP